MTSTIIKPSDVYCELNDILDVTNNDVKFLNELAAKYADRKIDFTHKTATGETVSVFESYQHYYITKDADADHSLLRSNSIFQKIADVCHLIKERNTLNDIYKKSQFAWVGATLPFHKDPRDCVLCIPLNSITLPLKWREDDGTPICEYQYKKGVPVLINTKVDHGCIENNELRNFFHISFNEDYKLILKYLKG